MPATDTGGSAKRKRNSEPTQPEKRRRSSSDEEEEEVDEDGDAKILLMEQGILESRKNYNDITVLLNIMREHSNGKPDSMMAAVALCRVFIRLIAQGSLAAKKNSSEKDKVVTGWLKDQFSSFKTVLLSFLQSEQLSITGLTLCMRILKTEGEHMQKGDEHNFPSQSLMRIVTGVLQSDDEDLRRAYLEDQAEQYDDVRFYTFKSVKSIVDNLGNEASKSDMFDRAFSLLSALDGVPESADELEDFLVPPPQAKNHPLRSVSQQKRQGQDAWLALMSIADGKDQRKKLLSVISTSIAPWFNKPERLADFLTSSYDSGGSMSLLALSGVFYLIKERNLDYPLFYHKLYSLLDRDILHSKHRSRFFRLLDTFLASTHLPAALVASFVKRLSRLALNAPPSAIVFVVPWIYNQLRRHPSCTFMLHRETRDPGVQKHIQEHGMDDPFQPEVTDPMETQAIESCLWELIQLQSHYHPNVATIAKVVSEQFTKHSYNMEDFLDHSYASLLEAEMGKEVKKAPVVEFQIPKRIFLPVDPGSETADSLLVKLWGF